MEAKRVLEPVPPIAIDELAGEVDLTEGARGNEGLRLARGRCARVILLDVNMDEMNGFEFLGHASLAAPRHVPIVVMTSMLLAEDQRFRLAKAASIVSKFELTSNVLMAVRDVGGTWRLERHAD